MCHTILFCFKIFAVLVSLQFWLWIQQNSNNFEQMKYFHLTKSRYIYICHETNFSQKHYCKINGVLQYINLLVLANIPLTSYGFQMKMFNVPEILGRTPARALDKPLVVVASPTNCKWSQKYCLYPNNFRTINSVTYIIQIMMVNEL